MKLRRIILLLILSASLLLLSGCGETVTYDQSGYTPGTTEGYFFHSPQAGIAITLNDEWLIYGPENFESVIGLEQDLADCYRNTLDLCLNNDIRSVAFCCISTGVFRFPNRKASEIAVRTVTDWLDQYPGTMERVIFNVFKEEDKRYYEQELL